MVWYGMVWYGMVWYGWYGMVWYGMVWYGMVWYGMVWYGIHILSCQSYGILWYSYLVVSVMYRMVSASFSVHGTYDQKQSITSWQIESVDFQGMVTPARAAVKHQQSF